MEFPFDVNLLLGDEITVVDGTLKPFSMNPTNVSQRRAELCKVIDDMGRASARAQGLVGPITSASKLKDSKHTLYLIKEEQGSSGYGAVVGLLKIGNKKLFVYDRHGSQHELEPLCVLDFYVHESCQRRGYGRKLFEAMLLREGVMVRHIAIDRPSQKFLSFLQKHYDLKATIPQVNNYVIFEGFFANRNGLREVNGRDNDAVRYRHEPSIESARVAKQDRLYEQDVYGTKSVPNSRPSSGKYGCGMMAQQSMYSRHQATPSPIELSRAAGGDGNSPGLQSPPMLRRDGPSREYRRLINENNGSAYLGRRGGHLHMATSNIQPSSFARQQELPPDVNNQQPAGTRSGYGTAWNVFGVPPRSWPNSVPLNSATAIAAGRKYQRTNLW